MRCKILVRLATIFVFILGCSSQSSTPEPVDGSVADATAERVVRCSSEMGMDAALAFDLGAMSADAMLSDAS